MCTKNVSLKKSFNNFVSVNEGVGHQECEYENQGIKLHRKRLTLRVERYVCRMTCLVNIYMYGSRQSPVE